MDDRDVVERASKTKHGEKFQQLYSGVSVLGNEEKDERSLMARLAMFTKDDEEQLIRVFKSSGQFRAEKPSEYYEQMAKEEMKFVAGLRMNPPTTATKSQGSRYANAKS
jgi:primase-polymerase (primpol)-like protein